MKKLFITVVAVLLGASMAFAQDLKKVQEITEKLGAEDTDLETSIKLYEEGIALVRKLEKQLSEAKRKVEIVSGSAADGLTVEPLEEDKTNG